MGHTVWCPTRAVNNPGDDRATVALIQAAQSLMDYPEEKTSAMRAWLPTVMAQWSSQGRRRRCRTTCPGIRTCPKGWDCFVWWPVSAAMNSASPNPRFLAEKIAEAGRD